MISSIGVYIHWPFCLKKCPYCDFNSHVASSIEHLEWQEKYLEHISLFANQTKIHSISSVFFGGGTPSLMMPSTVGAILDKLSAYADLSSAEITLEMNPTSFERGKLLAFKSAGINRLSIGVQSINDTDLQFLGRNHNASEAISAANFALEHFNNVSCDIIYAIPNRTLNDWEKELREIISIGAQHLSLYQLMIEYGTKFYAQHKLGRIKLPSNDVQSQLYEYTNQTLQDAGYKHYEVSNYAKNNLISVHNANYWSYGEYIGIGPGAHGRLSIQDGGWKMRAFESEYNPTKWLSSGIAKCEILDSKTAFDEMLIMGLRCLSGISISRMRQFASEYTDKLLKSQRLQALLDQKYLILDEDRILPTPCGMGLNWSIVKYLQEL